MIYNGEEFYESKRYDINPIIDRVGGGDSFSGGVIHGLLTKPNQGEALEFDTKESAERFLHSRIDTMYDSYEEYCETFGIIIKECVFYYEGGHLNATNKIIVYDEDDWEGHLENV